MERLRALTEEAKLDLTLVTGELPQGGELLLIPEPQIPLEEGFPQDVTAFAEGGGDLILWGREEVLSPLLERNVSLWGEFFSLRRWDVWMC